MATQFMFAAPGQEYFGSAPSYSGKGGKNGSFAFRKRYERVDWRKIASVDVDQISRTLDFNALQENIMNITFCNIEAELDLRLVDPNFVKLFKLSQLTIEYLLHSQDYLAGIVASHEEKVKKEKEEHNEIQKQMEKLRQELSEVKKESHKRKKMLLAQQQMMHAGSGSYYKCAYCSKAFLNNSFLQAHVTRRHPDSVSVSKSSSSPSQGGSSFRNLEMELQEIKERLHMTESQLQDERKMLDSLRNKENKTSSFINSHLEAFKEVGENNEMKELYMKELKEVNKRYMASEQALVELENRFGAKRSHLGNIEDDVEPEKSFLQRQKEDVAMLKEEMQNRMVNVEATLRMQLEKQERSWQKKMHKMTRIHSEELRKVNDALEHTSRETAKRATTPEARQKQHQVENLLRNSREQEKLLSSQEELYRKEAERQNAVLPIVHLTVPKSPRPLRPPSPGRMMSMVPSDEDDESTMLGTGGSGSNTGRRSLRSTMGTTVSFDPTLGTTQFLEQLRNNAIMKTMHDEFASLLEQHMAKNGIPPGTTGISQQVLDNKLAMLKTNRNTKLNQYPDFNILRQNFDRIAEMKAREQLQAMRKSPMSTLNMQSSLPATPAGGVPPKYVAARPSTQPPARSPSPRHMSPPPQGRPNSPLPPKPAPRSTTPQRSMYSTGSTTEWTSTQWDSDDDSEEEDRGRSRKPIMVTSSSSCQQRNPTPSPRPRNPAMQIKSKPLDDLDDWDDDSESYGGSPVKTVQSRVIMSQPKGGQNVSQLSRSIESQLSGRSKDNKPIGGVDTMQKRKQSVDILEDFNSDWEVSSVEDNPPQQKRPPTRSSTRGSHAETDFSTNTYGTSVWGSSSKAASTASPANRASTSKSSNITDVSSDDELDLENI